MTAHDTLSNDVQQEIFFNGSALAVAALPTPFWTTKGLLIWKRFNEANWRPQCSCGKIFNDLNDYHGHVLLWSSVYAPR